MATKMYKLFTFENKSNHQVKYCFDATSNFQIELALKEICGKP